MFETNMKPNSQLIKKLQCIFDEFKSVFFNNSVVTLGLHWISTLNSSQRKITLSEGSIVLSDTIQDCIDQNNHVSAYGMGLAFSYHIFRIVTNKLGPRL